jgi:hypothetical protein
MPNRISDRISEDTSDRISEDISDRMPEDLSIKQFINIMVGMTRNKII